MLRNPLSVHNPLPSAPLGQTGLMPLAPAVLRHHLPGTVRVAALVLDTEHTTEPVRPIPLPPALQLGTLMIHTELASQLNRKPSITPGMSTLVLLAEQPPAPLVLARAEVAPVIAAERRHAPVVAHVAPPRTAGAPAAPVLVAVAPRVPGGRHLGPVEEDRVAALGRLARVPGAVLAAARGVSGVAAVRPDALVRCAEVRAVLAAVWAVGGYAAVYTGDGCRLGKKMRRGGKRKEW